LSDDKKRPSLEIPAFVRDAVSRQRPAPKPGAAMDWRSVVPKTQPVRPTSGPPKPVYQAPIQTPQTIQEIQDANRAFEKEEAAPEPPREDIKPAPPSPSKYSNISIPNDDGINIELTGLPRQTQEPEEILSALPVENAPVQDDSFTTSPPELVNELESGIPRPLLLDDLQQAEFVQRFYNFGRKGRSPADPLSIADWKKEAEQVLLWKAAKLDKELKQAATLYGETISDEEITRFAESQISEMDPQLVNAISPMSPDGKDTRSLAVWLMDVFGLESYERDTFWSRCFPSSRWRDGTRDGAAIKFKTGFIYEPVPDALLLRKLQDVTDTNTFTTSNGDKIGTLSLNKRDDIIKELRQMLNPAATATAGIFKSLTHDRRGFATSEEIPKWVSVGPGYKANALWEVQSRPVDIGDRATFAVPCAYDPDADCPNFKAFLDETFEGAEDKQERIDALLEWIAAAIFGETTRRAKALYLYGYTATGKSVMCELVKLFFPHQHQTALGFDDLEDKVARGELSQSRLNVMGEAANSGKQKAFGSSTFKSAVSGDEIRCDVKFRTGYSFRPSTAFLYAANGRLPLNDCDDSIFRRLIIIHFQNPVPVEKQDPDIIQRFKGELSGILNLILEAAVHMMPRKSLSDPPSSKLLKRRWAGQVNSVKAFLDEECEWVHDLWTNKTKYSRKKKDFSTPITELHRAYKNWCAIDGLKPVRSREFRNRLDGLGIKTKQMTDGTRVPVLLTDPDKFKEELRLA